MRAPKLPTVLLTLALTALAACSSDASEAPMAPSTSAFSKAGTALPFKGKVDASETEVYQSETNSNLVHIQGTGIATQLGRFTFVSDFVLSLETLTGTQQSTLTAANGDVITATVVAQGIPSDDGQTVRTVESATITGGTGRFAGATGSYLLQRVIISATGISSGSFNGTINLDK
jgi:predicted aconitase with swiveling domain